MFTYAWDLLDEGPDRVAERLRSLGADRMLLAASYHTLQAVLPHNPRRRTITVSEAGLYFAPRAGYFTGTPIKPRPSPLVAEQGDALAAAAEACARHGIALDAWTVCMHNSRLAMAHPEFTVRNLWGESYPYSLCPSHPEVQAYLHGLVRNLAGEYGLRRILLESPNWLDFPHHHHFKSGPVLGLAARTLLSTCFCGACAQRARERGVNLAEVRRSLLAVADRVVAGEQEALPELEPFQQVRQGVVTDLITGLQASVPIPVEVILFGEPAITGLDPHAAAHAAAGVMSLSYSADAGVVLARARAGLAVAGAPERYSLGLSLLNAELPDRAALAQNIAAARQAGVERLAFYNYGLATTERLDWLGAALGQ